MKLLSVVSRLIPSCLYPSIHARLDVEQGAATATSRRHRKYLGVTDDGETQVMNLPMPANAEDIDATASDQEELQGSSLQAKKVVGLDNHGRMRFVDVPFYNRGGSQ